MKYRSVGKQISLLLILAILVPILIIGVIALGIMQRQMTDRYENQVKAENIRAKSVLYDVTSSMYTNCEPLVSVQVYRDLLSSKLYGSNQIMQYEALNNAITSLKRTTAAISSIYVYTDNPKIPTSNYIINVSGNEGTDPFAGYEWYNGIDPQAWDSYTCTNVPLNESENSYELTLVRRYNTGGVTRSYMVITISNNYLRSRLLTSDEYILACLDDHPVFFASEYDEQGREMPQWEVTGPDEYNYLDELDIDGKKYLTSISSFVPYKADNRFFVLVGDDEALGAVRDLLSGFFLVLFLAIAGPTAAIVIYSRFISGRVGKLREAMHRASIGEYDILDSFTGSDELADTFSDLKKTCEKIRQNEAKYFESKIQQQELTNMQQQMELKMLAGQINPHFLYNTLEAIRMQAIRGGDKDVATSVKYLAKIMHYVLETTESSMTTLEQELKHVDSYMQIQRLRFGEKINWNFYITDGVDEAHYPILPLLLQPIVENAVSHGLKNMDKNGHVSIIAEYEKVVGSDEQQAKGQLVDRGPNMVITINDDGLGMSTDELQALNESLEKKRSEDDGLGAASIGLHNIHQRIKLFYGEEYGLVIRSQEGKGTSVVLNLPGNPNIVKNTMSTINTDTQKNVTA